MAKQKSFTKVVLKKRREDITKPLTKKPKDPKEKRKEFRDKKPKQPKHFALQNDYHESYRQFLKKQSKGLEQIPIPFYVNRDEKLAFVILIQDRTNYLPADMCKILNTLRLYKKYQGVFVRLSEETYPILRLADPMIAWGYIDEAHVRTLVMKHAYGVIRKTIKDETDKETIVIRREPLQSNQIIEDQLGEHDVICLEDIAEVLLNPDDSRFPIVNAFLWTFELNEPSARLPDQLTHFANGGLYGNREEFINELIDRLI